MDKLTFSFGERKTSCSTTKIQARNAGVDIGHECFPSMFQLFELRAKGHENPRISQLINTPNRRRKHWTLLLMVRIRVSSPPAF